MNRSRAFILALTSLLLAGFLAACGSSASSTGGSSATASSSSSSSTSAGGQTVIIKGFKFTPSTLTVKPGTKVTFVMQDSGVQHNVRQTGAGGKTLNSPNLNKGQSYTVTFTKPGTYSYICSIHPFMKGSVTVT